MSDGDGDSDGAPFTLAIMGTASDGTMDTIKVTGKAARIVALLALYRQQINDMEVGVFEVKFADQKLSPKLTQSLKVPLDSFGLSD